MARRWVSNRRLQRTLIVAQGLYQPNAITMDSGHIYWANNNTTQVSGTRNSDGTIMMIVK